MRMRYSHRPLRATGMRPAPAYASPVVGCRRLRDGRAGDDDERRRHARRDLLCISFARDGKCVNETMWPSMKKSFSSEMDDTWDDYNFVTVVLTKWMWGLGESFIVGRRKTRSQTPPNSLSFFQTSGNPIGSERTLGSLFQTTRRRRKQAMWTPSPCKLFFPIVSLPFNGSLEVFVRSSCLSSDAVLLLGFSFQKTQYQYHSCDRLVPVGCRRVL